MKIINLTPHALNIATNNGTVTILPSGLVARVSMTRESAGAVTVDGITVPLYRTAYGAVANLPASAPDTLYVVSSLVVTAARDRSDLVIPAGLVRDDEGRIIGARGLAFPA